jgi:hypothetical protein
MVALRKGQGIFRQSRFRHFAPGVQLTVDALQQGVFREVSDPPGNTWYALSPVAIATQGIESATLRIAVGFEQRSQNVTQNLVDYFVIEPALILFIPTFWTLGRVLELVG